MSHRQHDLTDQERSIILHGFDRKAAVALYNRDEMSPAHILASADTAIVAARAAGQY